MSLDLGGRTALVTGASAGIGREIARLLAPEVGALILMARRRDRLEELARELAPSGARILVRPVDLLDQTALAAELDGLLGDGERIDALVNNAGAGYDAFFEESDWNRLESMIRLNVLTATYVLHRLVPEMVARGFGAILNIGSTAGMVARPEMVAYSATKAYINLLSEGLRAELAGTGVRVTTVCPGPVPTEFQDVAGVREHPMPAVFHVDAAACAAEAVAAWKADRARVIPGLPMRAAMASLDTLPRALIRPVMARMATRLRRSH